MGRYIFRLPDIGEGIAEAEIVAWRVKVGDRVEEDGPLADMMTDKATVEMESPVSGIVREVAGEDRKLSAGRTASSSAYRAVKDFHCAAASGGWRSAAVLRRLRDARRRVSDALREAPRGDRELPDF